MKQRSVAILAEYLSHRPIGRIVDSSPLGTTTPYLRSKTTGMSESTSAARPRLRAVAALGEEGRYVLPAFGLCGRCGEIHCDRNLDLETFRTCIPCQADLVQLALDLHPGTEVE